MLTTASQNCTELPNPLTTLKSTLSSYSDCLPVFKFHYFHTFSHFFTFLAHFFTIYFRIDLFFTNLQHFFTLFSLPNLPDHHFEVDFRSSEQYLQPLPSNPTKNTRNLMIFTSQSIKYPPNLHFFMFLQIAISCFQKHFTSRNFISLLFHFFTKFQQIS